MTIIQQICAMTPTPGPNPGVVPPWINTLHAIRVDLHKPPAWILPTFPAPHRGGAA